MERLRVKIESNASFPREKLKSNQRKEYLMIYASDLRDKISNLLKSQSLAVLASQKDGQSYANLVALRFRIICK
jgi:hypothetical protein